uniref:C-type lectin domain-containing protein n=1 Tax=Salarias fasciatus TaxID=181472 RepID=A0A672FLE1_SALFA
TVDYFLQFEIDLNVYYLFIEGVTKVTQRPLNGSSNQTLLPDVCPSGWKQFKVSCYFISDQRGSWDEGREDCKQRGADLVVIEGSEEMNFLAKKKDSWIGLNDREQEGTWKWVNGAPLTFTFWDDNQPDNWNRNSEHPREDCVHISHSLKWNDLSCISSQQWICENNITEIFANGLQL